MLDELFLSLSKDYEISKSTITKMAKYIVSSKGVNENNFAIILETAVSNYSSSKPISNDAFYIRRTYFDSCNYALDLEVNSNFLTEDEKTR